MFNTYPQVSGQTNFYERFLRGETVRAGWINQTDIDPVSKVD